MKAKMSHTLGALRILGLALLCAVQLHCSKKDSFGPTAPELEAPVSETGNGAMFQALDSASAQLTSEAAAPANETAAGVFLTNETLTTAKVVKSTSSLAAGSNVVIASGAEVAFQVTAENGKGIVLRPGFTAKEGSKFHAFVGRDTDRAEQPVKLETGMKAVE